MRVFVLQLRDAAAFTRAFDLVMEEQNVGSCMAEPEHARIRFLAPRKLADSLVQRIYGDGGLIWCSRHDLKPSHGASVAVLRAVADDGG